MLYTSHLYCRIVVGTPTYDIRPCIVEVGNCNDIIGYIPANQGGSFSVVPISLIGQPHHDVACITASFDYDDLSCISVAPIRTFESDRNALAYVDEQTVFYVCETQIGLITNSDIRSIVERYTPSDRSSVTIGKSTDYTERIIQVLTDAITDFKNLSVDIAAQSLYTLGCIVQGESYTDRVCEIVTPTKVSQLSCVVHWVSSPDGYSDIFCTLPRMVGMPLEYAAIEVVLGSRSVDQRIALISQALPESGDVQCALHAVVDGQPSWSRFTSSSHIYARLRNLGHSKVVRATLHYDDATVEADSIEDIGSIYQLTFSKPDVLPTSYLIIVTLDINNKVIVIDAPTGVFTL